MITNWFSGYHSIPSMINTSFSPSPFGEITLLTTGQSAASTVSVLDTSGAAAHSSLPAWEAVMVTVPAPRSSIRPLTTSAIDSSLLAYVTGNPDVANACGSNGASPKVLAFISGKSMVCSLFATVSAMTYSVPVATSKSHSSPSPGLVGTKAAKSPDAVAASNKAKRSPSTRSASPTWVTTNVPPYVNSPPTSTESEPVAFLLISTSTRAPDARKTPDSPVNVPTPSLPGCSVAPASTTSSPATLPVPPIIAPFCTVTVPVPIPTFPGALFTSTRPSRMVTAPVVVLLPVNVHVPVPTLISATLLPMFPPNVASVFLPPTVKSV